MSALLFALALFTADDPASGASAAPPAKPENARPVSASAEDYQYVAWCYGALQGYVDLHDQVMPEVIRIESAWRRPGSKLEADLAIYDDIQKAAKDSLGRFTQAMEAAEKASLRPLKPLGVLSMQSGRAIWTPTVAVTQARIAQEWMSWTLPANCEAVAASLEQRSRLSAAALQVNSPAEPSATAPTNP